MDKITMLIPCYNESQTIKKVFLASVFSRFLHMGFCFWQVIFMVDVLIELMNELSKWRVQVTALLFLLTLLIFSAAAGKIRTLLSVRFLRLHYIPAAVSGLWCIAVVGIAPLFMKKAFWKMSVCLGKAALTASIPGAEADRGRG